MKNLLKTHIRDFNEVSDNRNRHCEERRAFISQSSTLSSRARLRAERSDLLGAKGKTAWLLVLFLAWTTHVNAQSFIQVTNGGWFDPELSEQTDKMQCDFQSKPFPIDWDGDGDIDILSGGNGTSTLCYFENQGNNEFELTEDFRDLHLLSPYVIDWDNDGDYDVFAMGSTVVFYRNENGVFTDEGVWATLSGGSSAKFEFVDWDNDAIENGRDLDLIISYADGTIEYYECEASDGDCQDFTDYSATPSAEAPWAGLSVSGGGTYPAYGDLNGDGFGDLLIGLGSGYFSFIAGNSSGGFDEVIEEYQDLRAEESGTTANQSTSRLIDWDGDGHLDIVTGMSAGYISLFLQDADEDGYVGDDDCDPSDPDVNVETTFYEDGDGDGAGDLNSTISACDNPDETQYVLTSNDCDDNQPLSYPNAEEVCDTIDNNCDGQIDEATNGIDPCATSNETPTSSSGCSLNSAISESPWQSLSLLALTLFAYLSFRIPVKRGEKS